MTPALPPELAPWAPLLAGVADEPKKTKKENN